MDASPPARYLEPSMLVRQRLGGGDGLPAWHAAVVCFRDRRGSAAMVEALGAQPVDRKVLWGMDASAAQPPVYSATVAGRPVAVVTRCVWGGPQASIVVEELAALGVKHMIGFGAAGSLDPALEQGRQIVMHRALPTCGASVRYAPGPYDASPLLLAKVGDATRVVGASVDAVYRETPAYIDELRRQGAAAINMEVSAFYAAGAACGVDCLWLGHISDLLTSRWHDWYWDRSDANRQGTALCAGLLEQLA